MLHQRPASYRLIALLLLENQPGLARSFPSLNSSDPLATALQKPISQTDLCETLKFTLRRLRTPSPPLFDKVLYAKFVQAELAACYPLDAYDMLFRPRLPLGVAAYLDAVFDVLEAVSAGSNEMTGPRLCVLLGWWIWGNGAWRDKPNWEKLYRDWQEAGRRVEHLFYAWLR